MSTAADLRAAVVTGLAALPGALARAVSDYRDDLERLAPGATKYQLNAAIDGAREKSNLQNALCAVRVVLLHRLADPLAERVYTEGDLDAQLAALTSPKWWRDLGVVERVVSAPETEIARVGNVIATEITVGVALT